MRSKSDILRQPEPEVTDEQLLVIAGLLAGESDETAGARGDVSRATVQRWKAEPVFVARLNLERRAAWAESIDGLRALIGRAVTVAADALHSDDEKVRLAAAWKVLGAVPDIWAQVPKFGPSTVKGVESSNLHAELLDSITF